MIFFSRWDCSKLYKKRFCVHVSFLTCRIFYVKTCLSYCLLPVNLCVIHPDVYINIMRRLFVPVVLSWMLLFFFSEIVLCSKNISRQCIIHFWELVWPLSQLELALPANRVLIKGPFLFVLQFVNQQDCLRFIWCYITFASVLGMFISEIFESLPPRRYSRLQKLRP